MCTSKDGGYLESNSCVTLSVVICMLVSVATTLIKGGRGFGVKQDTHYLVCPDRYRI